MKLRQLFEADSKTIGLVFGRFNPPHKGHRAAWELASKCTYWYVGTNQSTQGPKDPLPYDVKVEAMKTIWPPVAKHIMAETSWLTLASHCYNAHKDADTLICFTDEDWVTKTVQQYNGKEGPHGLYNFKNIIQKPTPRLSSATALRDAVTKGDRDAFSDAAGVSADTPINGVAFFDLVAEYLLPYAEKEKVKLAKKKVKAPAESIEENTNDLESLQSELWDFYKDVHNMRPRHWTQEQWNDKEFLEKQYQGLINIVNNMSPEERKEQGWGEGIGEAGFLSFLKSEPAPKKKWDSAKDSRVISNKKADDDAWIKLLLDKHRRGIELTDREWHSIEQWKLKKAMNSESLDEAPIEMDPADPMDPMIHSHDKANPAKLKYRMLRAAGQLKDLAARAENASPAEWQIMARQFEELKMNMEQIRHALEELGKIRSKGGIRSRGITV
jgi:hypothetical protein